MNPSKALRLQFSLAALLMLVSIAAVIAALVGRAERQRQALVALRALDKYEEVASYSFYGEGPCARLVGPEYEPNWIARAIGLDLFYNVTNVYIDARRLDEAMPHLARLPGLREVYIHANVVDEFDDDFATRTESVQSAIQRIRREFPGVKAEENPGCMMTVSKTGVVG